MRCANPLIAVLAVTCATPQGIGAATVELEHEFDERVRPAIARYCSGCHGGATPVAGFTLEVYTDLEDVVEDDLHWVLVRDRLESGTMPPASAPQPPAGIRSGLVEWIDALRASVARERAGDPGPVPVRRLSNAEYNYTIRDLTGVDIRPASEFPVDPANPAGFDNSAESLAMSPALMDKYLQAARRVSEHLVLLPDGIGFAPHPMEAISDREKYAVARIVDFYDRQPTDYADYFEAAWRYRHRVLLGRPEDALADVARASDVSPGYLRMVWQLLEGSDHHVGPVAALRARWHRLPTPGDPSADPPSEQFSEMRSYVTRVRSLVARQFVSPHVEGLSATSQPLMNWKLNQFAGHRRKFDPAALRLESVPPPAEVEVPKRVGTGLGRNAEARAAAIAHNARAGAPELVVPDGRMDEYAEAFGRFSTVFPDAFYIRERGRFYPDQSEDRGRLLSAGYHNVMGFFRDDEPLVQMILDDRERAELDRLWDELDFIADASRRTWVEYYFNQSGEVQGKGRESGTARPSDEEASASAIVLGLRDAYLGKVQADDASDPVAVQAVREHFERVDGRMRAVEHMRTRAEPMHLRALVEFAGLAMRRPLADEEEQDLLSYYRSLRTEAGLTHQEAVRDSLVSVLVSPDFCYRMDLAGGEPGRALAATARGPVAIRPLSPNALANRLSYFLWASMPDQELLGLAAGGELLEDGVLREQAMRMLRDRRARGFVTEFAGNWLAFRRFEHYNAVDRERFPAFDEHLQRSMFEEPIRFTEDLLRNDGSVLDLLYADHTFVNARLARHYGMPVADADGGQWARVDHVDRYSRGGLLPMSVFLTGNSAGLRTSPVQRGHWIARRILGETIPPPPPVVPELPEDEAAAEASVREMLASHRDNPACSSCHERFDSLGLALEGYGPVGEARKHDLGGRSVDARAEFPGGFSGEGLQGLLSYIRGHRQGEFVRHLCRSMLAYALNRSLLLSDEPLVESMERRLAANGHRVSLLVSDIVTSPQFLNRRVAAARSEQGE